MKIRTFVSVVVLCMMTMVGVTCWCLMGDQDTFAFKGRVLQNDGILLIEPHLGEEERLSAGQFAITEVEGYVLNQDGSPISFAQIEEGAVLQITHSGQVLETYPAQFDRVYTIRVVE